MELTLRSRVQCSSGYEVWYMKHVTVAGPAFAKGKKARKLARSCKHVKNEAGSTSPIARTSYEKQSNFLSQIFLQWSKKSEEWTLVLVQGVGERLWRGELRPSRCMLCSARNVESLDRSLVKGCTNGSEQTFLSGRGCAKMQYNGMQKWIVNFPTRSKGILTLCWPWTNLGCLQHLLVGTGVFTSEQVLETSTSPIFSTLLLEMLLFPPGAWDRWRAWRGTCHIHYLFTCFPVCKILTPYPSWKGVLSLIISLLSLLCRYIDKHPESCPKSDGLRKDRCDDFRRHFSFARPNPPHGFVKRDMRYWSMKSFLRLFVLSRAERSDSLWTTVQFHEKWSL